MPWVAKRTGRYMTENKKNTGRRSNGRRRPVNASRNRQLEKMILNVVSSKNYNPMRLQEIAWLLNVPRTAEKDMYRAAEHLIDEGKIRRDSSGRLYRWFGSGAADARSTDDSLNHGRVKRGRSKGEEKPFRKRTEGSEKRDPADLSLVLEEFDIPTAFPDRVMQAADRMPSHLTDADYAGRLDLRDHLIITIDGDDSKDFDDAVSLEKQGSGYILGVHIADVSQYVVDGSALEKEALKRGTSVYLPDRVVPMLPQKLSNGICSLNEGEDRLTLSVIITMDRDLNILKSRIVESVICSAHRMTYSKVDRIFEGDKDLQTEYADIVPMLFEMKNVAAKMEDLRRQRGMIDFNFPETRFELDENGHPVRMYPAFPTTATKLIEQFMLTANEVVARIYADKQLPFVYRNHEQPDSDRMEQTLAVLHEAGVTIHKKGYHITPLEAQQIISRAEGTPEGDFVSSLLLRSMQQARYGTECEGHFGLSAKYYCHFTSPIRRYPDLQIHRIIKDDLHGRLTGRRISYYRRILENVAWKSSALERRSVETEREADKVLMTEYIADHLGETTEAVITGVTSWGFYVQRPDTAEGLVPASTLHDDYYVFDEKMMTLKGRRHGRIFRPGQQVTVKTVRADLYRRIIDFELAEDTE